MIKLQRSRRKIAIIEDVGLTTTTMWMVIEVTSGGEGVAAGTIDEQPDIMRGGIDRPFTRPPVIDHIHRTNTRKSGIALYPHPSIIVTPHIEGGIDRDRLQGMAIRMGGYTIHPRQTIVIGPHIEEEIHLGHLPPDGIEIAGDHPNLHVEWMSDFVHSQLVPPETVSFVAMLPLPLIPGGETRYPLIGLIIIIIMVMSMLETRK